MKSDFFQSFNFDLKFLWNWSFFHYEKIIRFKKVLSNLEMEGQGFGIIMGVTHQLLLGPFYYIALYWVYTVPLWLRIVRLPSSGMFLVHWSLIPAKSSSLTKLVESSPVECSSKSFSCRKNWKLLISSLMILFFLSLLFLGALSVPLAFKIWLFLLS